ncbi:hypothetical protein ACIP2X_05140 [Streptomyces sp. NPDC089424]
MSAGRWVGLALPLLFLLAAAVMAVMVVRDGRKQGRRDDEHGD